MRLTGMMLVVLLMVLSRPTASAESNDCVDRGWWQTSASLLIDYAECRKTAIGTPEAEKRHLLLSDVYIKARSYALFNKIFFWASVLFGVAVLLWPSLGIILKARLEQWEWVKSATVQTTVTGLAALMFAFYSQYKDKQVYAENLMRHVIYSDESTADLSVKVTEELSRIDRGFSFNSILGEGSEDE